MFCSGFCGELKCLQFCVCVEVILCFIMVVLVIWFMLQDVFQIQNMKCDNCIIVIMFIVQYFSCICWIVVMFIDIFFFDDVVVVIDCIVDIVYCIVCVCIQMQYKMEMDKRDGLI